MAKIESLLSSYCASGLYTHVYAACGFLEAKENLFEYSIGDASQTVFDLASITKAVVTTPLIISHCKERKLNLRKTTTAETFGAEACQNLGLGPSDLTVADFLRHQSGLPAWRNFYVHCDGRRQSLNQAVIRFKSQNPFFSSGLGEELYSDVGFMVLGELLVSVYGKPLGDIWLEYVRKINFETEQEIGPTSAIKKDHAVPTAYCPVRQRQLTGEVHDENAWGMGGFAGHAGLFGSGEGLTRFLRALWRHENGRQVFSENFAEVTSPGDSLLGWRKGLDEGARTFAEGRGCGHLGFTGTAFWVDPLTKTYAVVLTNRVISGRVSTAIKRFRAEVFAELWKEIKCYEKK